MGQNKYPVPGWHPPAGLAAFAREVAERRGVSLSTVLNEALWVYRDLSEGDGVILRESLAAMRASGDGG